MSNRTKLIQTITDDLYTAIEIIKDRSPRKDKAIKRIKFVIHGADSFDTEYKHYEEMINNFAKEIVVLFPAGAKLNLKLIQKSDKAIVICKVIEED